MMNRISALVFSCAIVVSGCNSSDGESGLPNVETVDFTVSYIESSNFGSENTIIDRPLEPGNRLNFRFIPGHVFGNPLPEVMIDALVGNANMVGVTFDDSIFTENSKPEILSVSGLNDGLTLEPIDTRLGRLGTFLIDASGQFVPADVGHGLYDKKSGLSFIMVYFDRPAILSGSIQREIQYNFDIEVAEKGFYALGFSLIQQSDGSFQGEYSRVLDLQNEAYFAINIESQ